MHVSLSLLASNIRSITVRFLIVGFRNCSSWIFTRMPFISSVPGMFVCNSRYQGCHCPVGETTYVFSKNKLSFPFPCGGHHYHHCEEYARVQINSTVVVITMLDFICSFQLSSLTIGTAMTTLYGCHC